MNHYDRDGKPISLQEWMRLFEDKTYQVLQQDRVGETLISTVWLGIDHGYGQEEPLIFETMVFGGQDEEQHRYASEAEALRRHQELVERAETLKTL